MQTARSILCSRHIKCGCTTDLSEFVQHLRAPPMHTSNASGNTHTDRHIFYKIDNTSSIGSRAQRVQDLVLCRKKIGASPGRRMELFEKKKGCMIFCRPRCDHIYMPPLYHGVTPSCCSKRSSTVAVESTEHANLPTVLECGSCRPCYIMCARVFMCTIPAS